MKRIVLFLLSAGALFPVHAQAATVVASSCSHSAVLNAYNAASAGDTISVPAGNCAGGWSSYITITKNNLKIQGAGIDQTTIGPAGFLIPGNQTGIDISGFTFHGGGNTKSWFNGEAQGGPFAIKTGTAGSDAGVKDFRIHHNKFRDYRAGSDPLTQGANTLFFRGFVYGVVDHNEFFDCTSEIIWYEGDGQPAWNRTPVVGGYTNGTLFVETNTFSISGNYCGSGYGINNIIDGNCGERYVFRNNTVTDAAGCRVGDVVDSHGSDSTCKTGSDHKGVVSQEVYNNTFHFYGGIDRFYQRSGTGMYFGNQLFSHGSPRLTKFVELRESRLLGLASSYWLTYNNRSASCASDEGYPCLDQINNTYIWNNTLDGSPFNTVTIQGSYSNYIQAGRDYFTSSPGSSYTPYAYPHPLASGGSPPPPPPLRVPAPPSGLQARP